MFCRWWLVATCVTLSQACDSPPGKPAPASTAAKPATISPAWEELARTVSLVEVDAVLSPISDAPYLIVNETAITRDGATIAHLEHGAFRADDLADGEPRRVAENLARIDRSIDTLQLLVASAHTNRLLFQIIDAAPPTVTRFGLVVRTPRGLASIVIRREATPVPTLEIKRSELQLGAQIIAIEPAAQRTEVLRTALVELAKTTKHVELVVEPTQSYRVLAEVAATVAPLFEEVRAGLVPRETPSMITIGMFTPPALYDQIDQSPFLRCARTSLRYDVHALDPIQVKLTFVVAADGSTIERARADGGQLPPALARCFVDMLRATRLKAKPGAYEIAIEVTPR